MRKRCWKQFVSSIKHKNSERRDDLTPLREKLLARSFFESPPECVARLLLGKILVYHSNRGRLAGRIVETEAYLGEQDPAAHAACGRTARNAVLYGEAGHAYVYSIYGLHQCMNVSCLPAGVPGCVLLRAIEPLDGIEWMRANRRLNPDAGLEMLTSGPGKICQAFGITRAADNGCDLTDAASPLGLREDDFSPGEVIATPRIGIRKAAELPLRFFIAHNPCVSRRGR